MHKHIYRHWAGWVAAVAVILGAAAAGADTISLKDGRTVQGQFFRQGNHYVIQPYSGSPFSVSIGDVTGIVLGPSPHSKEAKGHHWNVLHYKISRSANLPNIISGLRRFIRKYPHSPSLPRARKALIKYRQYQKLNLVKFSGHWMSASTLAKLKRQSDQKLRAALAAFDQGLIAKSLLMTRGAIKTYPESADAWVVAGVIEARLNRLQAALRDFTNATKLAPEKIAALTDAAVVNYKIHRQPRALLLYTHALTFDSGNRLLLDNVYAALRKYRRDRKNPLYRNLAAIFTTADVAMEARMAKQGLYRVGGTWVNAKAHKKLAARLAVFKQQKNIVQANYDSTVLALKSVNAQLRQTNIQIANLQTLINSLQIEQGALSYQTGYIDLNAQSALNLNIANLAQAQARQMKLQNQRIAILAGLENIRLQAKHLEKSGPGVALSGKQRMLLPRHFAPVPPPISVHAINPAAVPDAAPTPP